MNAKSPGATARALAAEAMGTSILLVAVVGSGIMAERLAGGNEAIALLANTAATAAALIVLILVFAPTSGAHFNPAVTLALALRGDLGWRLVPGYVGVQIVGAILGVGVAHFMFDLPLLGASLKARTGVGVAAGEFIATFGLVGLILVLSRNNARALPGAVAAWIAGAYWFTSSTSFANPAVTIARSLSDTFTGIRPLDAPAFIAAEILGALAACGFFAWLMARK
jgi:glycerol uptake facilitator-like aquaporin